MQENPSIFRNRGFREIFIPVPLPSSLWRKALLLYSAHAQYLYTPINMISMADYKYANDKGDVEGNVYALSSLSRTAPPPPHLAYENHDEV